MCSCGRRAGEACEVDGLDSANVCTGIDEWLVSLEERFARRPVYVDSFDLEEVRALYPLGHLLPEDLV